MRRVLVAALTALLGAVSLAHADEAFLRVENGSIVWSRDLAMPAQPSWIVQLARMAPARNAALELRDDPAALEVLSFHGRLRGWALMRLATLAMEDGDDARADSCLALAAEVRSEWNFDAIWTRYERAMQRGDTEAARAALGRVDRQQWSFEQRIKWNLAAARHGAAAGDTAFAFDRAWTILSRSAYGADFPPDSTAPAAAIIRKLPNARDDGAASWRWATIARNYLDARNYTDAALFFEMALGAGVDEYERFDLTLELIDTYRRARKISKAKELLAALRPTSGDSAEVARDRAAILLARAQVERRARRFAAADRLYAKSLKAFQEDGREPATEAARERADLAWARGRWGEAHEHYKLSTRLGRQGIGSQHPLSYDSYLRAGLMALRSKGGKAAAEWWLYGHGTNLDPGWPEGFWLALGTRRTHRARADSILHSIAATPGFAYRYYQAASRESLGIQPATDAVAEASLPGEGPAWLRTAELLLEMDDGPAVRRLLERAILEGKLSDNLVEFPTARHWLRASSIAYSLRDYPLGIRLAFRARWTPEDRRDGLTTEEILPWIYPPAFDAAFKSEARRRKLDPDLFRSIGWQESFYDEDAVSRVGALGVMQFMPATGRRVAGQLGETLESDSLLLEADRSIRFSAHYFSGLLRRYGGRVPKALAAYNAGPGNANRWSRRSRGWSDAYFVEMIDFKETRGYVQNILAVRQAYRTFKPHWADSMAVN